VSLPSFLRPKIFDKNAYIVVGQGRLMLGDGDNAVVVVVWYVSVFV
jgi:hypothetical protein